MNLIQNLNDHKAELTRKVATLAAEKAATERQTAEGVAQIGRLRATVAGQELSQEDVRRMQREGARAAARVAERREARAGHAAALAEALDRRRAVLGMLERTADEDNATARRVGLASAVEGGHEVRLAPGRAEECVAALLGDVDLDGVVGPRVEELAREHERKTASETRQIAKVKDQIELMESSSEQVVEDIEVRYMSCI